MRINKKQFIGVITLFGILLAASLFIFSQKAQLADSYKFVVQNSGGTEVFKIDESGNLVNFGAVYDLNSAQLPASAVPGGWTNDGFEIRNSSNQIVFYVETNGNVHADGRVYQNYNNGSNLYFPMTGKNLVIKERNDYVVAYITDTGSIYLKGYVMAEGSNIVYAFVTDQLYTGDFNGLDGADVICQSKAQSAGLTGTYKAWLSIKAAGNEVSVLNRLDSMVGSQFVIRNSGNKLISNGLPLSSLSADGEYLFNPINRDQNGNLITDNLSVFTGTNTDGHGALNMHCGGWEYWTSYNALTGLVGATNQTWTQNIAGSGCSTGPAVGGIISRLYCFKQPSGGGGRAR